MKDKRIFAYALMVFMTILIIQMGYKKYGIWKSNHSGIPDVVSSIRTNNDEFLTVVANCNKIEDKKEFARELIHMYIDNSFQTIKFMETAKRVTLSVYLQRKDIEVGNPICQIKYAPYEYGGMYDMKADADKYRLYLDGEEIEFF